MRRTARDRAESPSYHHGNLRSELLALARRELEAKGLDALSLRELAAGLGVSKSAPYRHFPDKDALLRELMERGWVELGNVLRTCAQGHSSLEGLRAMGRAYLGFALAHPAFYRLLFSGRGKAIAQADACPEGGDAFRLLVEQVHRCQAEGWQADRPLEALTLAIWAQVHGCAELCLEGLVPVPPGIEPLDFWAGIAQVALPA